jgi:YHS domain-containing protein
VRGSKGSKVLRTRKIKQDAWNEKTFYKYFCSNSCYNDFANANIERIRLVAPRNEPLETPIEDPKREKHETGYGHAYYNTTIKERVDNDSNVG